MIELQVVILTRDRLNYLFEAIQSFLVCMPANAELIISDNSARSETEHALKNKNGIKYVRRWPPVSSAIHFEKVVAESSAPFLIMFHDDDLVSPDYLQVMLDAIRSRPKVVAVACNAYILKGGKLTSRKMMGFFSSPTYISSSYKFLTPYFSFGKDEPPPFSGYIYRTDVIKKCGLSSDCGKHSDVSTLNELLKYGDILWLPQCLMFYRYHNKNDGRQFSLGDKLKLLRYAISRKIFTKQSKPIIDMRVRIHLNSIRLLFKIHKFNLLGWRVRILTKFLLINIVALLFSTRFWIRIFSRRAW